MTAHDFGPLIEMRSSRSFDQGELADFGELQTAYTEEIHARCRLPSVRVAAIPAHRVMTNRIVSIGETSRAPAPNVVHFDLKTLSGTHKERYERFTKGEKPQ